MQLTYEELIGAIRAFNVDSGLLRLPVNSENNLLESEDLLAFILLETDFLKCNPEIEDILLHYTPTVDRTETDHKFMNHAKYQILYEYRERLNNKQNEWAKISADLHILELEIDYLINNIRNLNIN